MTVMRLSIEQARHIAISAQLLTDDRPTDLVETVGHLWSVQLDPTAAVAPSADLVAWSRLGTGYRPQQLVDALGTERALFEYRRFVRVVADLALYRPLMASWPEDPGWSARIRAWMLVNGAFRRYLLNELEDNGPMRTRDLDDRSVEPWASTGWTNNRNVTQMLEFTAAQVDVAISGRSGRQRLFDVARRVYPHDVEVIAAADAQRIREQRFLRSLGITRDRLAGDAGVAAEIDGVKGVWRVDPDLVDLPFTGRVALLSPFDRLVHDRARLSALFGFDYHLEMYTPPAKRQWGYYALPVLFDDRFVGAVDAKVNRKISTLAVNAIRLDPGSGFEELDEISEEIDQLSAWLGVEHVTRP